MAAEIRPVLDGKPGRIGTPIDVSEESQINGFVFSPKLLQAARLAKLDLPPAVAQGRTPFRYANILKQIASDSDGGPTIGENSIEIWIDNADANAGSTADYIWAYFGRDRHIKLWGTDHDRFPKGAHLSWNLNDDSEYLETIPADDWDEMTLATDSGDGIKINRIVVKHSSVTITDWTASVWLDASKLEQHSKVGLAAETLSTKLAAVSNRWNSQIHWASRELGKTDSRKYGTTDAWCSEFASWCLRKALLDTPAGSIDSADMQEYFRDHGRMFTRAQILNKEYTMFEGDYLRFQWADGGHHSALFTHYIDDSRNPTENTRFGTIEGNTGSTVAVRTRTIHDIVSVGNTR